MKAKLIQFTKFNWQLFISLCALALVPAIYQTIKTFIISLNHQSEIFNIIGQMEWFDLINETLQAFLIIPLYSILNKILKNNKEKFACYTFKTGLISFIIYALFSIGVLIYGSLLIKGMNKDNIDISKVNTYLQLETIAFMIGIIISFINVVFVVVGKAKNVYIFLAIKIFFSIIADLILIPNLGVYGIAISNIFVNAILALISFLLLYLQKHIKFCLFHKTDFYVLKEWFKIGVFSGGQQFIDNFIYAIMICKMINMVSEQGNYWIVNNFIWGWLLIPVSALTEVIKHDCKDGYNNLKQGNYYSIALIIITLWIITIPLWTPFYKYAENLKNARELFFITIKLMPFYIAYLGCAIIDNVFIGLGKTIYNAINSLIINLVYYGIFYILYITGKINFTMDTIILMFGCGMVVHFAISLIEKEIFIRKIKHC